MRRLAALLAVALGACATPEGYGPAPERLVVAPRPGNPGQYVVKDPDGNRTAVIRPRPGNPGQYVIEDASGSRIGTLRGVAAGQIELD